MALTTETVVDITFGIVMALLALIAIYQAALYAVHWTRGNLIETRSRKMAYTNQVAEASGLDNALRPTDFAVDLEAQAPTSASRYAVDTASHLRRFLHDLC